MTDQQRSPVPPPPAPGGYPAGYAVPAQPGAGAAPYPQQVAPGAPAPVYQAPPGAFAGPAGGYLVPPAPGGAPQERPALGRVALILALIATVALTAVGAVLAGQIAQGASSTVTVSSFESGSLAFLTPVRDLVLWFEITGWTATALGIWALVQGIVAIVKRRGRGAAIAAVVIAVLGPFVYLGVAYAAVLFGAMAGLGAR